MVEFVETDIDSLFQLLLVVSLVFVECTSDDVMICGSVDGKVDGCPINVWACSFRGE